MPSGRRSTYGLTNCPTDFRCNFQNWCLKDLALGGEFQSGMRNSSKMAVTDFLNTCYVRSQPCIAVGSSGLTFQRNKRPAFTIRLIDVIFGR